MILFGNTLVKCLLFQVLLGPVHAAVARRQPYHPARRHLLLQRRPQHALDSLQLPLGHHLPHRHRRQLPNW